MVWVELKKQAKMDNFVVLLVFLTFLYIYIYISEFLTYERETWHKTVDIVVYSLYLPTLWKD